MNIEKKEWQTPSLEVLEISETKKGIGFRQIDWISEHDGDLYNPS